MKFYVKTRSTDVDYKWINISNTDSAEPVLCSTESELEIQKSISDFEKTCFWAESPLSDIIFICFIGIATNRKDKFNRPIRADIVVETKREKNSDNEKLLDIIFSFIKEIKQSTKDDLSVNSFLSQFINKALVKNDIDDYFLLTKEIDKLKRLNSNDDRINVFTDKLNNIRLSISKEDFFNCAKIAENNFNNNDSLNNYDHYLGDINNEKSYNQFLKAIEEIVYGTKHYKVVGICNVISEQNELIELLKQEKEQCILLGKFNNFNHNGMIRVEAKKKSGYFDQTNTWRKREDTHSYSSGIISSKSDLSNAQSSYGSKPYSDDTGAFENRNQSIKDNTICKDSQTLKDMYEENIPECIKDFVKEKMPEGIKKTINDNFGNIELHLQSEKQTQLKKSQSPSLGTKFDQKG